jgi:antitoxin VapB
MNAELISIVDRYQGRKAAMAETGIAKIFMHGRSQAVRLPREFRLPGDRVRVRRMGSGILLEPIPLSTKEMFDEIDRIGGEFPEEPEQPPMPSQKAFLD